VLESGFDYRSEPYASLTAIAKAITGTNWSGPRFFGLHSPRLRQDCQSARCRRDLLCQRYPGVQYHQRDGPPDAQCPLVLRPVRARGHCRACPRQGAISKAKGMWMGGGVPLGYRVEKRKLLVASKEAETVWAIGAGGEHLWLDSKSLSKALCAHRIKRSGTRHRRRFQSDCFRQNAVKIEACNGGLSSHETLCCVCFRDT
jgi:hypothetical protein